MKMQKNRVKYLYNSLFFRKLAVGSSTAQIGLSFLKMRKERVVYLQINHTLFCVVYS